MSAWELSFFFIFRDIFAGFNVFLEVELTELEVREVDFQIFFLVVQISSASSIDIV